jgi:hypothetical protein
MATNYYYSYYIQKEKKTSFMPRRFSTDTTSKLHFHHYLVMAGGCSQDERSESFLVPSRRKMF